MFIVICICHLLINNSSIQSILKIKNGTVKIISNRIKILYLQSLLVHVSATAVFLTLCLPVTIEHAWFEQYTQCVFKTLPTTTPLLCGSR